jgi:hypothetical protein
MKVCVTVVAKKNTFAVVQLRAIVTHSAFTMWLELQHNRIHKHMLALFHSVQLTKEIILLESNYMSQ